MKICAVRDELFHADGRIDMKLTVAFRNFANAPKAGFCGKRDRLCSAY